MKRLLFILSCILVAVFVSRIPPQHIQAIDLSTLNPEERFFADFTQILCSHNFTPSTPISEAEKLDFFTIMCSEKEYSVESEGFFNEETELYEIPLDYINEIITTYLTCDALDTTSLAEESEIFKEYFDSEHKIYRTLTLGGLSELHPTVLLESAKENNTVHITLGKLDKNEYAKNNIVLEEKYSIEFLIEDLDKHQFKIITITCEK